MSVWTWSPFQSADVREICRNMTPAEADRAAVRAFGYGAWVFASVIAPIRVFMNSDALWAWILAGTLLAAHVVAIPLWQRGTRRFLLATRWAQSRGYPADLRLFQFRRAG